MADGCKEWLKWLEDSLRRFPNPITFTSAKFNQNLDGEGVLTIILVSWSVNKFGDFYVVTTSSDKYVWLVYPSVTVIASPIELKTLPAIKIPCTISPAYWPDKPVDKDTNCEEDTFLKAVKRSEAVTLEAFCSSEQTAFKWAINISLK